MKLATLKAPALALIRVFLATVLACWLDAGTPVHNLAGDVVVGWVELGLTASVGLVLANYFGPWETRYGTGHKARKGTTPTA